MLKQKKYFFRVVTLLALLLAVGLTGAQAQGEAAWTILFYSTADTSDIEDGMMLDINEVEYIGSTAQVNFVAQVDRTDADSSWTDARRFLLTQDGDWQMVNSEVLAALGEVNQGEVEALVDFARWGITEFPAQHYALIISDHGGGWTGIGWDMTDNDDQLTMLELDDALTQITGELGRKLDFIGFDACLMAQYEVLKLLSPYADYAIVAEETEPAYGWAYDISLATFVQNPGMGVVELGKQIVDDYVYSYAQGEWSDAGYTGYDLNLIDLAQIPAADAALNAFARAVQANSRSVMSAIGDARNNAQFFGGSTPDEADLQSSIDLIHFLTLLMDFSDNAEVNKAAADLRAAVQALVVHHAASAALPGANGVAIYFPRNQRVYNQNALYTGDYAVEVAYLPDWQSFLSVFYGETVAAIPPAVAAGLDVVNITGVYPGGVMSIHNPPVITFSTDGQDILEVVFSATYVDEDSGFQIMLDEAPLTSAEVLASGESVVDFPDGYQLNEYAWGVEMPVVTDGSTSIPTLLLFNRDDPNEVTISGRYIYADGREVTAYVAFNLETRTATNVWGVAEGAASAPFNLRPKAGEQFLPTWRFLDETGQYSLEPAGDTPLIFGDEPFTFSYEPAISGTYTITIRVEDIAGNLYLSSETITVDNEGLDTDYRGFTDVGNGLNFLYPWDWPEPTYIVDEEADTSQTVISNDDESINIYITLYAAESREDMVAAAEQYVAEITDAEIVDSGEEAAGGYDADYIQYEFTVDGEPRYGFVLAVYVPELETGYLIDMDTTEAMLDAANDALDALLTSLNFFTPPEG